MRDTFSSRLTRIAVLPAVVVAFFGGAIAGGMVRSAFGTITIVGSWNEPPAEADFTPLYKAWHLLDTYYVPPTPTTTVSVQDRVYGAVKGLAAAYHDPYTTFLPPVENKLFTEDIRGSFGGVGIEIGIRDGVLTVVAPLKGTPAERAGLQAGDVIIAVDGELTQGWTIEDAVLRIRGKVGAPVTLTIVREGEPSPRDITIVRGEITIPTIDTAVRGDAFIISLYNFGGRSVEQFRQALREFVESPARTLIIDLRNNPGGFLDAAVEIASYFLPAGAVVVSEYRGEGKPIVHHRSRGYNVLQRTKAGAKVFVLINRGSASASEILAGALQDHKKAVVIGERSFGKGSVQELFPVDAKTNLKITVAHWLTPSGKTISKKGIQPDIPVKVTLDDVRQGRDRIMERALEEARKP